MNTPVAAEHPCELCGTELGAAFVHRDGQHLCEPCFAREQLS